MRLRCGWGIGFEGLMEKLIFDRSLKFLAQILLVFGSNSAELM